MTDIKFIILSILFVLGIFSCKKTPIDEGEPPTTVKYNPDVQEIMFNYCITCHSGAGPSAGLDLSNYQNVRFATENGNLSSRIIDIDNPMPPSGLLKVEDQEIITKWIENGYWEN